MDIYYCILEITENGITVVANEKTNHTMRDIYRYDGVEFQVLYADDEFV